jgi:hypothetical protein
MLDSWCLFSLVFGGNTYMNTRSSKSVWLAILIQAFWYSFLTCQASGQFSTVLNIPPDPDIGDSQSVGSNTQINLAAGGSIGHHFSVGASDGSSTDVELNISGGVVDHTLAAYGGGVINISGGEVGSHFAATSGSKVNISGGVVGNVFLAADGSHVSMTGGSIGRFSLARGHSLFDISGGSTGNDFEAEGFSQVNFSGGALGDSSQAEWFSTVNISGGSLGSDFHALDNSVVNISGGSVGSGFQVRENAVTNVSGGTFSGTVEAWIGSSMHLSGKQFLLGFLDITPLLTLNVPVTITDRDVKLSGILAEGEPFSFTLNSTRFSGQDFFDPAALVTITLVPEPTTCTLALAALCLAMSRRRGW